MIKSTLSMGVRTVARPGFDARTVAPVDSPSPSLSPEYLRSLSLDELRARMAGAPGDACGPAPAAAAAAVGLSSLHISASRLSPTIQTSAFTYAEGGRYLRLKADIGPQPTHLAGARRGDVVGFSKESRRRMMDFCAQINLEKLPCLPLFVTLTYPASFPSDHRTYKRHLDNFRRAFDHEFGKVGVIWKLEFQERSAPHFHLFVFGLPYMSRYWLRDTWYRIVASGDPKHLRAGTQVKRAKTAKGVARYVSKYMTKVDLTVSKCGRHWGVWHRSLIPRELVVSELPDKAAFYRSRRVLCKLRNAQRRPGSKRLRIRNGYAGIGVYAGDQAGRALLRWLDWDRRYLDSIAAALEGG